MRLPTHQHEETRRIFGAFAALRANPYFVTVLDAMRQDLAALDAELRAAPVSEEIGKTQGRALYAAEFIRLADDSAKILRGMTS